MIDKTNDSFFLVLDNQYCLKFFGFVGDSIV